MVAKRCQGENVLMKMNIKCNNIYLDENDLLMVLLIVPIIIFFLINLLSI